MCSEPLVPSLSKDRPLLRGWRKEQTEERPGDKLRANGFGKAMNLIRRIPILPTLLVLIAVGVMVRLGVWQLDRRAQKEAMLAQYARSEAMSSSIVLPPDPEARARVAFRHVGSVCQASGTTATRAGRNLRGESGWAHWAVCTLPDGVKAQVNVGWSKSPAATTYTGGNLSGIVVPDGPDGARIVATIPAAGLEANASPDPRDLPNNHLSYAVQWFLFAATALVIYGLALRKRLAA